MAQSIYRFGPFTVDRARYRVLRGDAIVELTPKLLDLLLHLLEHAGELVTKEQAAPCAVTWRAGSIAGA